jgi:hypothetical protein
LRAQEIYQAAFNGAWEEYKTITKGKIKFLWKKQPIRLRGQLSRKNMLKRKKCGKDGKPLKIIHSFLFFGGQNNSMYPIL